jgi:5-oxopent-3-ene-1,2,5-tricarboxylate decarboxylase/2-hydroxyhepta-2,4-diene-1,7-dioate isomerase
MLGTVYGVVLNDRVERAALVGAFSAPPYAVPPNAPVLYIKPRNTHVKSGAIVPVPGEVVVAATLALTIGAGRRPDGSRLALDIFEPHDSYFRPAIRERCRDAFLPLGGDGPVPVGRETIVTSVDGVEVHRWSLDRMERSISALLTDVGDFMSLQPGDLLLVGLAGDAPRARAGARIEVACDGHPPLVALLSAEAS